MTQPAVRLARLALSTSHALGYWLIVFVMFWIVADVFGRVVLDRPLSNTRELVTYLLPIIVFLQIPHILVQDRHLRSPIVTDRVGTRTRMALELLRDTLGALLFAVAAYATFPDAWTALRRGYEYGQATLLLPAGPARLIIVFGSALLAGLFVARVAMRLRLLPYPSRSRT